MTCETDFIPDGTNPRKCVENGWEDAAPVCVTDGKGMWATFT